MEKLLTVKEVGDLLSLSVSKVYELISKKKLAHYRIEGSIRIGQEQIQEYLEKSKQERKEEQASPPSPLRQPLRHLRKD